MHKSDVPTCLQDVQPDTYVWLILGCFTCLIFPISCFYLLRTTSDGKSYDLGGFPIFSAWKFFSKRYDFMWEGFRASRGLPFRFRVLQHRIVTIPGQNGRKLFYNNSSLDMSEGYKILLGATPRLEEINMEGHNESELIKRTVILLRKERIIRLLPLLLDDINRGMLDWGREGAINPFNEVYDLVFHMTLRFAGCDELCRDRETMKTMAKLYWDLEKSTTAASLLLPWFPSPARRRRTRATRDLYILLLKVVQNRRAAGASTQDAIDVLIQKGDKDSDIVELVIGTVFAGVVNTGMISSWALLHLGIHDEWRQRAVSEIQAMVSAHGDTCTESLHQQLASIPLSAWEEELPALEFIIRETIRLSNSTTFLRRNLKTDIDAEGVHIARGDFMAYPAGDVHMNEDIYPNPGMFDPGRYEDGRNEDKRASFGFVGWGAGRHVCTGMRMAKLEIKFILAILLLGYDYTLVDKQGNRTSELPVPDRNDSFQSRPLGKPVYLKFKRMKD